MHLQKDFTTIYHVDLHGNVRKNPKLSGTTHNVFGIQVGVGIIIAVRISKNDRKALWYYRVPEYWRKTEKLDFLAEKKNLRNIVWLELLPDERNTWITDGLKSDFATYLPLASKEARSIRLGTVAETSIKTIFKTYSLGSRTSRDDWAYDFDQNYLQQKMTRFIETYKGEVDRWRRRDDNSVKIDDFVSYDDTKIKWSEGLKDNLRRGNDTKFDAKKIRQSLYRPFSRKWLYFDRIVNERVYQLPLFFSMPSSELENIVICVPGLGDRKGFGCLAANTIPSMDLAFEKVQCFPFYTYSEDGSNRRENITDWALKQFQAKYGEQVSKWDIFHYVYGMLHHPQYRELYRENLKRDLPHIPLVLHEEAFGACVSVGRQLMTMHVDYEVEEEYPLREDYNRDVPYEQSLCVEKMKLSPDKTTLLYSKGLTLEGIPPECFAYRLGNRSALEWVIDQYQVSTDKRSGIESDPNRPDDAEYIVRLVKQVVTVSVKTVQLVQELTATVTAEDWVVGTEGL
jgi:predicted helicase